MALGTSAASFAADDATETAAVFAAAVDATPAAGSSQSMFDSSDTQSAVLGQASGGEVDVPQDPQQGITIGAGGGPSVTVALPVNNATSDATVVSGTAIYSQPGAQDSIVAQPLSDGSLRAAVSITGPDAPMSYSYDLTLPAGVEPVLNDAGGVDLIRAINSDDATGVVVVGGLQTPWATDANGDPVATRYTIVGHTITQHVDFGADSAFPIVADPHIKWHWYGPGLKFNRTETGRLRNRTAVAAAFGAICALTGPETLGITCGVAGAVLGTVAAVSSTAYGDHKCLEMLWGAVPRSVRC